MFSILKRLFSSGSTSSSPQPQQRPAPNQLMSAWTDHLAAVDALARGDLAQGKARLEEAVRVIRPLCPCVSHDNRSHLDDEYCLSLLLFYKDLESTYRQLQMTEEADATRDRAWDLHAYMNDEFRIRDEWLLFQLAERHRQRGALDTAVRLYGRILGIYERQWVQPFPEYLRSLMEMGRFNERQDRTEAAEAYYSKALMVADIFLPDEHPDVITVMQLHAALLHKTDRQERARSLEESIRVRQAETERPAKQDKLDAMERLKRFRDGCLAELKERKNLPCFTPAVLNLARDQLQHDTETSRLDERAREVRYVQHAFLIEAAEQGAGGCYSEQDLLLKQALCGTNVSGEENRLIRILTVMADAFRKRGRFAEAEALYRDILIHDQNPLKADAHTRDSVDVSHLCFVLAYVCEAQGKYAEAIPLLKRARLWWDDTDSLLEYLPGFTSPSHEMILTSLAIDYLAVGRQDMANHVFRRLRLLGHLEPRDEQDPDQMREALARWYAPESHYCVSGNMGYPGSHVATDKAQRIRFETLKALKDDADLQRRVELLNRLGLKATAAALEDRHRQLRDQIAAEMAGLMNKAKSEGDDLH